MQLETLGGYLIGFCLHVLVKCLREFQDQASVIRHKMERVVPDEEVAPKTIHGILYKTAGTEPGIQSFRVENLEEILDMAHGVPFLVFLSICKKSQHLGFPLPNRHQVIRYETVPSLGSLHSAIA